MEKFTEIINKEFQKILQSKDNPKYHKFFDSFNWWKNSLENWENDDNSIIDKIIKNIDPKETKYNYDNTINISDIKSVSNCKYIPKKVITSKQIYKIYNVLINKNISDFDTIRFYINKMFDYNLPSTIDNIDDYLLKIKDNNDREYINVIIVGAGPIGLFTALYLDEYYNRQNLTKVYINILLLDNRIYKEGIKLPYSRITQFGFDIDQIQPFIKNIFCWNEPTRFETSTRQFDFINTLENLLYVSAFERKIPMYFTKKFETFDKIKNLAKDNNFNYIFDATGGKLDVSLNSDVIWNNYSLKENDYEVKYIGNNKYKFYVNDKEYNHITLVLQLFTKKMKPIWIGNYFGLVTNENDNIILNKYKDICYKVEDYLKIIRHLEGRNIRYLLFKIMYYLGTNLDKIKYIKITTFNTNSTHVNKVSEKIDENITYIGIGNTLGTSEYGIYFGLRDGMLFSKYICNLLSIVKYL